MAATMATRLASASFNALARAGSKLSMNSVSSRSCANSFSSLSARSIDSTDPPPSPPPFSSILAPASFDSPAWIARCRSTMSCSAFAVVSLSARICSLSRSRCSSGESANASFSSRSATRRSVRSRVLSRSASARCLTWSPPSARSVSWSSAVAFSISASASASLRVSRSFSSSSVSYSARLPPGSASTFERTSRCSRSSCASASFSPLSRVTLRSNASSSARRSCALAAASDDVFARSASSCAAPSTALTHASSTTFWSVRAPWSVATSARSWSYLRSMASNCEVPSLRVCASASRRSISSCTARFFLRISFRWKDLSRTWRPA